MNVMIVEDEGLIATLLKIQIENLGWKISCICSSGMDAINEVNRFCPDIILMDINLQGEMDGIEAAENIKDKCPAKFVFISGYSINEYKNRLKEVNPFEIIQKPIFFKNLEELKFKLENIN